MGGRERPKPNHHPSSPTPTPTRSSEVSSSDEIMEGGKDERDRGLFSNMMHGYGSGHASPPTAYPPPPQYGYAQPYPSHGVYPPSPAGYYCPSGYGSSHQYGAGGLGPLLAGGAAAAAAAYGAHKLSHVHHGGYGGYGHGYGGHHYGLYGHGYGYGHHLGKFKHGKFKHGHCHPGLFGRHGKFKKWK